MKDIATDLTVYIAGPMSGLPDMNREAFNKAEKSLINSKVFAQIFNPARRLPFMREVIVEGHELERAYKEKVIMRDLEEISKCDCAYFLSGWENSKGAKTEHALANYLGLTLFYESRLGTW